MAYVSNTVFDRKTFSGSSQAVFDAGIPRPPTRNPYTPSSIC
jgi:hypothetical protein